MVDYEYKKKCHNCGGTGEVGVSKSKCYYCKGKGNRTSFYGRDA